MARVTSLVLAAVVSLWTATATAQPAADDMIDKKIAGFEATLPARVEAAMKQAVADGLREALSLKRLIALVGLLSVTLTVFDRIGAYL